MIWLLVWIWSGSTVITGSSQQLYHGLSGVSKKMIDLDYNMEEYDHDE